MKIQSMHNYMNSVYQALSWEGVGLEQGRIIRLRRGGHATSSYNHRNLIFRTRSIGGIGMCACKLIFGGMSVQLLEVACPLLASPLGRLTVMGVVKTA